MNTNDQTHAAPERNGAPEAALRASELRYRTLFDKSSEGILMADLQTQSIRFANPAAVLMLGYTESELSSMSVADLHPKESLPGVLEEFEAVALGKTPVAVEIPYLKKDGTIVFAEVSGTVVTIDGRAMHAGFFRDVTERRQARRDLEASETRYRRLFESAKDGVLILDAATGKIVDVNPFLTELTGYSRADFLGQHLWEIGLFKDTAASKGSFADLQAREYVRYEHLPLEGRDGRKIDVEFVSNVYLVHDHKVIQCNIRDITVRKRIEAERERLSAAIEQAAEVVLVVDVRGNIVYANPAFEAVTGYSQAEALGRNPRFLKSGVQDEGSYRALWQTISAGKTWRGRLINRKKDGKLYTQEGTIAAVRDSAGVLTSYVAVARDISQDLALESQFLQAQKMEAVGRLAGGIAHDFNNVLSVILSYAELIGGDLEPDEPLRADVQEIRTAALRATELTRQLLAFSRQQVLETKVLDLYEMVTGMEKMLRRLLGADIELTVLPASELWNIKADPGQIEQILMNLAVNA
ncbi:MAG TPA: PAS domain S-box protein, partial [Polyangiaceae bacterium]